MSDPKYKLGDDGELEEIIDEGDEKPKRKRKPKYYPRTIQIPVNWIIAFLGVASMLGVLIYVGTRPEPQRIAAVYPTPTPRPSETPGGYLDQVPPCGMLPVTQKARFAFEVEPSDYDRELLRMDIDGTNACRLTNNDNDDDQPTWSPDGKQIAFIADFSTSGYQFESLLYIMDANSENLYTVTKGFTTIASPAWSPDGKRIAFQGTLDGNDNSAIYVINPDGKNLVSLTNQPSVDTGPNWSPDGKSIVFASDRSYLPSVVGGISQPDSYEIYVMDADGSNVRQLTFNKLDDVAPKWSPNGQWIAYQEADNIYIMDKNGEHVRRLTDNRFGAYTPFWMPDGSEVGYSIDRNAIQLVNIQTGQTRSLRTPGNPSFIAVWSPPS